MENTPQDLRAENAKAWKNFEKLSEAKKWLIEAKYDDEHNIFGNASEMAVNCWFNHWIGIKEKITRFNTVRMYKEYYLLYIKEIIGDMLISEVKPLHCQAILDKMYDNGLKSSTIAQCRIALSNMFTFAVKNEVVLHFPVKKSVKAPKKVRFLTLDEQKRFLEAAKSTVNYYQFAFLLQTGLRTGELVGLKWEDIDFKKRTITINRIMDFLNGDGVFRIGKLKSKAGHRVIPMTQTVYDILIAKKHEAENRKICNLQYNDFVFLNRKGMPTKSFAFDNAIYDIAKK